MFQAVPKWPSWVYIQKFRRCLLSYPVPHNLCVLSLLHNWDVCRHVNRCESTLICTGSLSNCSNDHTVLSYVCWCRTTQITLYIQIPLFTPAPDSTLHTNSGCDLHLFKVKKLYITLKKRLANERSQNKTSLRAHSYYCLFHQSSCM